MLACSAVRASVVSLLDRRPVPGTGGVIPSVHEVLREARFGWFACEVALMFSFCWFGSVCPHKKSYF